MSGQLIKPVSDERIKTALNLKNISIFQPCTKEGVVISQVEHEEEAHGVPEEGCGQTPEALLTCRVPQLELNALAASLEGQVNMIQGRANVLTDFSTVSFFWPLQVIFFSRKSIPTVLMNLITDRLNFVSHVIVSFTLD